MSAATKAGDKPPSPAQMNVDLSKCKDRMPPRPGPPVASSRSSANTQLAPPVEVQAFPGEPTSAPARNVRASPFGGSLSGAPLPRDFTVVAVDVDRRTLTLRSQNGITADVQVGERVYDISTLAPGAKIKVDFALPSGGDTTIRAASIWPVDAAARSR